MTDFDSGNNETIYFKVEDCNICATTEKSEASQFYVRYSNRNRSLQLQHGDTSSSQSYGYLAICEQKSQSIIDSVTPERWFQESGNEAFFIRCSAKPDTTPGNCSYLCVRRKASAGCYRRQTTYSTSSVPNISDHNKRGRSMLFKLVRASESEPRERPAESEML